MLRRFLAPLLIVLVAVMAAPVTVKAEITPDQATSFVQSVADRGINRVLRADVSRQEQQDRFRDIFLNSFDVDAIARFVLGRHSRGADQAEIDRFTRLFREYNILIWAQRFDEYQGQELKVTGTRADGDKGIFVETQVVDNAQGSKPINIIWRLRERSQGPLVVDLVVEGVSMALTYRSEYDSIVSRGGLGKLNDLLEQKVQQLKGA